MSALGPSSHELPSGRGQSLPRAAITTYHKLGVLKQQQFILSQIWRMEYKTQVSPELVPSGGSEGESDSCLSSPFGWARPLLGNLRLANSSLQSHLPPVFTGLSSVSVSFLLFLLDSRHRSWASLVTQM